MIGHCPGILYLYDPSNIVFTRLDTGYLNEGGLYTGNVLSLLESAVKAQ
jgi:hypothetical protein